MYGLTNVLRNSLDVTSGFRRDVHGSSLCSVSPSIITEEWFLLPGMLMEIMLDKVRLVCYCVCMVGHVVRNQIPMIMTFSKEDAEFICNTLGHAIERGYQVYDMFIDREDQDPWEDNE